MEAREFQAGRMRWIAMERENLYHLYETPHIKSS